MAVLSQPLNTIVEPLPHPPGQQSDRTKSLTAASQLAERHLDGSKSPPPVSHSRRHASSVSITGSAPRHQRTPSILSRAVAALDRTQSVIASIGEPVIRNRQSNPALARLSLNAGSHQQLRDEPASPDRPTAFSNPSTQSLLSNPGGDSQSAATSFSSAQHSPSQPPNGLNSDSHSPKMHQTSSRLLRMTDDERPFTRVCSPLSLDDSDSLPSFLCLFVSCFPFSFPSFCLSSSTFPRSSFPRLILWSGRSYAGHICLASISPLQCYWTLISSINLPSFFLALYCPSQCLT